MIELLVMRHAKSDWDTGVASDFDRPLSPRGDRAASKMARWLDDNDLRPDRVLSSAAERARSTAQYVVNHFGIRPREFEVRDDLYLAGAWDWIEALRLQSVNRLMICGHNPGCDDLVEYLSADEVPLNADGKLMTTASIAHFSFPCAWSDVAPASGALLGLARPREL